MTKKDTLLKLKEQERELRRTLIIQAAREVFGDKTYDKVSMAEIADAAGIAKSSIYTYFKSQEELYARIAYLDLQAFIRQLKKSLAKAADTTVQTAIDAFLEYYVKNKSQWRMITHFALHGSTDMESVEQLNVIGRELMDLFDEVLIRAGVCKDSRLMSHTLFSCLSGVLIAFMNYPGRSEQDRVAHMKRVGQKLAMMLEAYIRESGACTPGNQINRQ